MRSCAVGANACLVSGGEWESIALPSMRIGESVESDPGWLSSVCGALAHAWGVMRREQSQCVVSKEQWRVVSCELE